MGDLSAATDTISPLMAVLWVFYPMAALVLVELILRTINDDDDDQDGGKGIRIAQPFNFKNMHFIVFGCILAATAYTNVFSFVLQ